MSRHLPPQPGLFEARYGLAVLEQDAGRATAAYEQALAAIESAPSDVARAVGPRHRFGRRPLRRREGSRLVTLALSGQTAHADALEMVLRAQVRVKPVRLPSSSKAFRGRSSNRCATT